MANKHKDLRNLFTDLANAIRGITKETDSIAATDIPSIIREKFAWIGLEISTPVPSVDKESITDNNYLVRTLQYLVILPNSICKTEGNNTFYNNKRW